MAYVKDPGEVLDYAVDWSAHLADGDTIVSSSWVVATGLTVGTDSETTTRTTIWLSGGTAGTEYRVTNTVTTAQGRTFERSFTVTVQDL